MFRKKKKIVVFLVIALAVAALGAKIYQERNLIYLAAVQFSVADIRAELVEVEGEKIAVSEVYTDQRFETDHSLMLINRDYTLDEDLTYEIEEYLETGILMNSCMIDSYKALSAAVREETESKLSVLSHYRTREEQRELYEESPEVATLPGASEHESGLCLDVCVIYYAGENFIKTPCGKFVNSRCWEYGFIIRYPHYGYEETGIPYEPWHIRYVGKPHAEIIYANSLTLEEYIFSYAENLFYRVNGYIISRQRPVNGEIIIPKGYEAYHLSPDNTGCYFVTVREEKALP